MSQWESRGRRHDGEPRLSGLWFNDPQNLLLVGSAGQAQPDQYTVFVLGASSRSHRRWTPLRVNAPTIYSVKPLRAPRLSLMGQSRIFTISALSTGSFVRSISPSSPRETRVPRTAICWDQRTAFPPGGAIPETAYDILGNGPPDFPESLSGEPKYTIQMFSRLLARLVGGPRGAIPMPTTPMPGPNTSVPPAERLPSLF